jgi:pyridoxal phosphate enzyme (YggS family)
MPDQIAENIRLIEKELASSRARLLPVSKTFPPERILEAYRAGCRDFGENRVQEILEKKALLPQDIRWHLIGHLQTNKVKQIAGFIHLIHSVDSEKLLAEIDRQGARHGRQIACLLQVFIAKEETKSGWDPDELRTWFREGGPARYPHIRIRGLMGMATFTDDESVVRAEFRNLGHLFAELARTAHFPNCQMEELSMGMSGDYRIACEEGSTLVRMGTAVFGGRYYPPVPAAEKSGVGHPEEFGK